MFSRVMVGWNGFASPLRVQAPRLKGASIELRNCNPGSLGWRICRLERNGGNNDVQVQE
jgi:hypothetical protein